MLRRVDKIAPVECTNLTNMFFGKEPEDLAQVIEGNLMYFDTLFMHIQVSSTAR